MMKKCQKFNLQEPQRNRNATANYVNLIKTSTVHSESCSAGMQICLEAYRFIQNWF